MLDRMTYRVFESAGFLLCELAFKTGCRGPFAWAYRAGCWCYGKADDAGIRSGALIENPAFKVGGDAPLYVRRK